MEKMLIDKYDGNMNLREAQEVLKENGYFLKEDARRNNTDISDIYSLIDVHDWSPEWVTEQIMKHYYEELPKIGKILDKLQDSLKSINKYIIENSEEPSEKIKFKIDRFNTGINLTILKNDKIDWELSYIIKDDKIVIKEWGEIIFDDKYNISNIDSLINDNREILFGHYL